MALTDTHSSTPLVLSKLLTAPFRALANGFVALMENNSRIQQIDRLNAMSDTELAKRGLTRDGIVNYVFRDYMHV